MFSSSLGISLAELKLKETPFSLPESWSSPVNTVYPVFCTLFTQLSPDDDKLKKVWSSISSGNEFEPITRLFCISISGKDHLTAHDVSEIENKIRAWASSLFYGSATESADWCVLDSIFDNLSLTSFQSCTPLRHWRYDAAHEVRLHKPLACFCVRAQDKSVLQNPNEGLKSAVLKFSNVLSITGFNRKPADRSNEPSACFDEFVLRGRPGTNDDFQKVLIRGVPNVVKDEVDVPLLYYLELQLMKHSRNPPAFAYCTDIAACCCAVLLSWIWSSTAGARSLGSKSSVELSIQPRLPLMYAHEKMESLRQSMRSKSDDSPLIELVECIGVGGCGAVYKVLVGSEKKMLACKVSCNPVVQAMEEATWSALDGHSHVAPVVFAHSGAVFTKLYEHGSLADYVQVSEWSRRWMMSPDDMLLVCRHVASQIGSAVGYMHSRGYVHLDLKPQNVLVSHEVWIHKNDGQQCIELCDSEAYGAIRSIHVCISDFGLANREDSSPRVFGTAGWNSPEQRRNEQASKASDVYSLGLLLSWLFHPQNMHPQIEIPDCLQYWRNSFQGIIVSDNFQQYVDGVWMQVATRLLSRNSSDRPSAFDVVESIRSGYGVEHSRLLIFSGPVDNDRQIAFRQDTIHILQEVFGANTASFFEQCCRLVVGLREGRQQSCVVHLFPKEDMLSLTDLSATEMVLEVAGCFRELGHWNDSLDLATRVKNMRTFYLKSDNPLILRTSEVIAQIQMDQGDYHVALEELRNARTAWGRMFPRTDDPNMFQCREMIALCHLHQSDYQAALLHFEPLYNSQKMLLHEDHPCVLRTRQYIAQCLVEQEKYDDALKEYCDVLHIQERKCGEFHSSALAIRRLIAQCWEKQEKFDDAYMERQFVLSARKSVLGAEHLDTLSACHDAALWLEKQEKFSMAIAEYAKVQEIQEKTIGDKHALTLDTRRKAAFCLQQQGKYDAALAEYNRIHSIEQELRNGDLRFIPITLQSVAKCLQDQEKYDEALENYRQIFEMQTNAPSIGAEHSSALTIRLAIASCLEDQEKYDKALKQYREVFGIQEKNLHGSHPSTLTTRRSIALCQQKQGDYKSAYEEFRKIQSIQESVVGKAHPSTVSSGCDVARCLQDQEKYSDALAEFDRVLTVQREFGNNHPSTLSIREDIALCLEEQEKFATALEKYLEIRSIRVSMYGAKHQSTLSVCCSIARCLENQEKYEAALIEYQAAFKIQREVWGEDHLVTLSTHSNIVSVLGKRGEYEACLSGYNSILDIQLSTGRASHFATRDTVWDIARLHEEMGNDIASCEYQEIRSHTKSFFGDDHPSTFQACSDFARYLCKQGSYEAAIAEYREIQRIQETTYGVQHPSTLLTRYNVAICLKNYGNFEDALSTYKEVRFIQEEVFGAEHPSTIKTCLAIAECLESQAASVESEKEEDVLQLIREAVLQKKNASALCSHCLRSLSLPDKQAFNAALKEYELVYESQKAILGDDHLLTLTTRKGIVSVLKRQAEYAAALAMCRSIQEIQKRTIDLEHASTRSTDSDIQTLERMLKYDGTLSKYRNARFNAVTTTTIHESIAECLQYQKKYDLAVAEYEAMCRLELMKNDYCHYSMHYDRIQSLLSLIENDATSAEMDCSYPFASDILYKTTKCLYDIALCFQSMGKYTLALAEYSAIHEIHSRTMGVEHAIALVSRHGIAVCLEERKEYDAALAEYYVILDIQARTIGSEHTSTLATRKNIAAVLQEQRRYSDAPSDCKLIFCRADRLSTIIDREEKAQELWNQGNCDAVLAEYQTRRTIQESKLGAEHPHTLRTRWKFAHYLARKGEYVLATDEFQSIHDIIARKNGDGHHSTIPLRFCIADCLESQRKFDAALAEYHATHQIFMRFNDAEHHRRYSVVLFNDIGVDDMFFYDIEIRIVSCCLDIAECLQKDGEYDAALTEFRKLRSVIEERYGANHVDVLTISSQIAQCLLDDGQLDAGLTALRDLLEAWKKIKGEKELNTFRTHLRVAEALQRLHRFHDALNEFLLLQENLKQFRAEELDNEARRIERNVDDCLAKLASQ
eukprot:ANDGO_07775.mRNA.1 Kinesin light chain